MVGATAEISILVPAYNEGDVIYRVVSGLRGRYPQHEIIVVDDGSEDDTSRKARDAGAGVIRHPRNRGYGSTWKSGVRAAKGSIVVFFDGDGQMQAEDVERLLVAMHQSGADMVSGSRKAGAGSSWLRRPGKALLRWLAEFLVNQRVPDLNCGLRAVKKSVLMRYLHLLPEGFSASTTSMMVFLQRGYMVTFVPIEVGRRLGKSTVRFFSDGFGTLMLLIRLIALFNPLRFFLPVSLSMLVFSVVYSGIEATRMGLGIPVLGAVMFIGGLQVFVTGIVCDQVSALRLERFEDFGGDAPEPDSARH